MFEVTHIQIELYRVLISLHSKCHTFHVPYSSRFAHFSQSANTFATFKIQKLSVLFWGTWAPLTYIWIYTINT